MTLRRCLILALFVCGCGRTVPQDSQTKPFAKEMLAPGATTTSMDALPCPSVGTIGYASTACTNDLPTIAHDAAQRNRLEPICTHIEWTEGPGARGDHHASATVVPCPPPVFYPPDTNCPSSGIPDGGGFCHNGTWYFMDEVSCLQEDTSFGHKGDCTILNQPSAPICLKVSNTYTPLEVIPCPPEK